MPCVRHRCGTVVVLGPGTHRTGECEREGGEAEAVPSLCFTDKETWCGRGI